MTQCSDVVIGGGQAYLAAGYHLRRLGSGLVDAALRDARHQLG
ncbi:hypothetical protein ACFVFI_27680 [Streptomyces sp. NPDC057705]